jgi:3-deoxy-D-manno-octulosonic acid (KDO) 8-phosphate synthase
MPMNRDQPPENENTFFVNITAAYQFLKDWRLKNRLEKIKKYEKERIIYECRECVYNINGNCKFRETAVFKPKK